MKFKELNLHINTLNALDALRYSDATEIQEKAIPVILSGADVVARSQTGSGKTLAFGLPIIEKINFDVQNTQCLIVCPTRELAMQVCDEIKKITAAFEGIAVVPVYGGANIERQIKALKRRPKIVVGTPGRIIDHLNRRTLKLQDVKTVVLDEADEMLNMGFKDDIEKILKAVPSGRQTLLFSATFPQSIRAITKNYQSAPVHIEIGEQNKSLENITQKSIQTEKNGKQKALLSLIAEYKPSLSIVFCNTKRMTEIIKNLLVSNGINALCLHGDMRQRERTNVMREIKTSVNAVLVATDVAARGIDISNVDIVFNFDLPNNAEYFLHRIGRTARAGKSGQAITIINSKEQARLLAEFEKETKSDIVKISSSYITETSSPYKKDFQSKRPFNKFRKDKPEKINKASKENFIKSFDKDGNEPLKVKPYKFEKPYNKNVKRNTGSPYDKTSRPDSRGKNVRNSKNKTDRNL